MTANAATKAERMPERFAVGEWVDLRKRVAADRWEGSMAEVTRVNGLEVFVNVGGNTNDQMAFFPRSSDGKHVRMLSAHGAVPDYEFAPTWIFHGQGAKAYAEALARNALEEAELNSVVVISSNPLNHVLRYLKNLI